MEGLGARARRRTWRRPARRQSADGSCPYMMVWPTACCGVRPSAGGPGLVNQDVVAVIRGRHAQLTCVHLVLRALVGQQPSRHQLHAQQLDRIGADDAVVQINDTRGGRPAASCRPSAAVEGQPCRSWRHPGYRDRTCSRWMKLSCPSMVSSPTAIDDQHIVLAETQIDVARKADLAEHHGGGDAQRDGDGELQHHQGRRAGVPSRPVRNCWCAAPWPGGNPTAPGPDSCR